jgi:hypothetical protein
MHDNLLLRAAKSGQAEDGVQDGESGGGDAPPPVEGLAQAGMIMRYLPIRRVVPVANLIWLAVDRESGNPVVG